MQEVVMKELDDNVGKVLQKLDVFGIAEHTIVVFTSDNGPEEELGSPLLFNLRRDPFEKAAEKSGNYMELLGKHMWVFGPAKRILQQHLAAFKDFPSRSDTAHLNAKEIEEKVGKRRWGSRPERPFQMVAETHALGGIHAA